MKITTHFAKTKSHRKKKLKRGIFFLSTNKSHHLTKKITKQHSFDCVVWKKTTHTLVARDSAWTHAISLAKTDSVLHSNAIIVNSSVVQKKRNKRENDTLNSFHGDWNI